MDTTSNALSRALQNLAKDLNVQEHLRDELLEAHAGDNILYDELNSLPYLDAVCRETLRLYAFFNRIINEQHNDQLCRYSLASFVSRVSVYCMHNHVCKYGLTPSETGPGNTLCFPYPSLSVELTGK